MDKRKCIINDNYINKNKTLTEIKEQKIFDVLSIKKNNDTLTIINTINRFNLPEDMLILIKNYLFISKYKVVDNYHKNKLNNEIKSINFTWIGTRDNMYNGGVFYVWKLEVKLTDEYWSSLLKYQTKICSFCGNFMNKNNVKTNKHKWCKCNDNVFNHIDSEEGYIHYHLNDMTEMNSLIEFYDEQMASLDDYSLFYPTWEPENISNYLLGNE